MSLKINLLIIGVVALVFGVYGIWWYQHDGHIAIETARCVDAALYPHDEQKIDCWYNQIRKAFEKGDVEYAFHVFSVIYEQQPLFAQTGCHRHAHRVGDLAYYEEYIAQGVRLEDMVFPDSATSCGYGFFHGFIEHLIQDNPTVDFIEDTCTYLSETYGERMGAIQYTCYHGAGHGLLLAQAEKVPRSDWGNMRAFIEAPLRQCDELGAVRAIDREECQQGLFNIIVDWMSDEEYGFTYDHEHPFSQCPQSPATWKSACYYEMAQKLDAASDRDPRRMMELVQQDPNKELQRIAFGVGVAGIMQHLAGGDGHYALAEKCVALPDPFDGYCIHSIVSGLFEHGDPRNEHVEAKAFCASDVVPTNLKDYCWNDYVGRIYRFHGDNRAAYCSDIPEKWREQCMSFEGDV